MFFETLFENTKKTTILRKEKNDKKKKEIQDKIGIQINVEYQKKSIQNDVI